MNVRTGLTGAFPRSEALVQATRDLDRGRATLEEVEALYSQAENDVVRLEERLGLQPLTAGYLRWPDLFRPIAESWEGFTVGPLTRWFETNTFYRQPVLHSPPARSRGAILQAIPPAARAAGPGRTKVILPGPYTFAGLLENRSGETSQALVHRLGRLLAEEVAELRAAGYTSFQFQEPLLVVRPPDPTARASIENAYQAIREAAGTSSTIVWTFFGDAHPVAELLYRLPVNVVGVDLSETEVDRLPVPSTRRALGLGCLDPRTTLIEDPAEIANVARAAQERLHPSELFLGPGGPLDLLPWEPATRKLHSLPAARQALESNGGSR
jgi:5-methyltetrahydropteroyltriglutamate--homocysteine methyltransferase